MATDVARVLGGVAPHLMVTDPPYGVNYDPAWRNQAGRSINGTTRRIAAGTVIKPIGARAVGKVVNDDRADWREAWALFPGSVAYIWHAGTKAGIVQLARTAATEWALHGVRVNALGPGVVETPLTAQIKSDEAWYDAYANKSPMRRWAQPGEMVGPTLFLLSDAASYVTGTIIYADGGWLAADGRFTPPGM